MYFFCCNCKLNLPSAYDDSQELFSSFESKIQTLETNLLSKISLINNSCQTALGKVTQEKSASLQKVETLGVSIRENHDKLQSSVSSLTSKVNDLQQENKNLQFKLNSLSSQAVQSTTSCHSALDTVNELEDRNRRKCNLIIHKLPLRILKIKIPFPLFAKMYLALMSKFYLLNILANNVIGLVCYLLFWKVRILRGKF